MPSAHVLDGEYEVGHRVDLGGHVVLALGLGRRGNEEHFVVDDDLQLQFVQQELQGGAERDPLEILGDLRGLVLTPASFKAGVSNWISMWCRSLR